MIKKDFNMKNLTKIRKDKKLTQLRLSTEINVSQELISQYEIGSSLPSILNLITLADYFHCSIDYLVGRTNNPTEIKNLSDAEIKHNDFTDKYNTLSSENKKLIDEYIEFLCNKKK